MMNPKKRRLVTLILAIIIIAAMVLPMIVSAMKVQAAEATAAHGLYIENVSIAGLTESEVAEAVRAKIDAVKQDEIVLYVNGMPVTVTAGELGLTCTNTDIVSYAMNLGKSGNAVQRFRAKIYLEENNASILPLYYTVDYPTVVNVLQTKCSAYNLHPVNVSLIHQEGGGFTLTEKQDGYKVDIEATAERLVDYMTNDWHGGRGGFECTITTDYAQEDMENLSLVKDVLGTGSTTFVEEPSARNTNIAVGVSKLNGILLAAGQEISVCDAMAPYTAEAGYLPAASYELGSVVDSYGGGICQVSTTLYQAVLAAELDVTMRVPHSMLVGYISPGLDAAISEDSKDFRFVNNTDAPIYIEGTVSGGVITFTIYGHETRDSSRTVKYVSELLDQKETPNSFNFDSNKEYPNIELQSAGHPETEARAWKIVYVNGVEESRENMGTSYYQSSANIYTIGTKNCPDNILSLLKTASNTGVFTAVAAVLTGQANTVEEINKTAAEAEQIAAQERAALIQASQQAVDGDSSYVQTQDTQQDVSYNEPVEESSEEDA